MLAPGGAQTAPLPPSDYSENRMRQLLGFPPRHHSTYNVPRVGDGGGGPPSDEHYAGLLSSPNAGSSSGAANRTEDHTYGYPTFAEILLRELKTQAVEDILKSTAARSASFLAAVRLDCGSGEALLIDTGAYDGLAGSEWFDSHIATVNKAGLGHLVTEKPTTVMVSGVGKQAEACDKVVSVPGVLADGTELQYEAPKIPGSSVPALCGMQTLDEQNMAVLPWNSQLARVPKGKEHLIKWPEGTTFIQCQRAKTGHMMLPIGHFDKAKKTNSPAKLNKARLAFNVDNKFFANPSVKPTLNDSGHTSNLSGTGALTDLQAKLKSALSQPSAYLTQSATDVNAE